MVITVSTAKVASMAIVAMLGFLLPIGGMIVWWYKKQASFLPFLAGFSIYVLGVLLCEQIFGSVLFKIPGFQPFMENHVWLLAIYGGLIGCIFEEGAKYLGFKYFLKNMRTKEVSVSFGLGFAALPAVFNCGMQMMYSAMIVDQIKGKTMEQAIADLGFSAQSDIDSFTAMVNYLMETKTSEFVMSGLESVAIFLIQAFLAILVFRAIEERRMIYLGMAMVIRFLFNFVNGLYAYEAMPNVMVFQVILILLAIATVVYGVISYRNMCVAEKTKDAKKETFAYHKDNSGKSLRSIMNNAKSDTFATAEEQEEAFQEAWEEQKKDK